MKKYSTSTPLHVPPGMRRCKHCNCLVKKGKQCKCTKRNPPDSGNTPVRIRFQEPTMAGNQENHTYTDLEQENFRKAVEKAYKPEKTTSFETFIGTTEPKKKPQKVFLCIVCNKPFITTSYNAKRCPDCRIEHDREYNRERLRRAHKKAKEEHGNTYG